MAAETTTAQTGSSAADGADTASAALAEALAGRLFGQIIGMMEIMTVYLGDRLSLYQAIADAGPMTAGELAARTGTAERYVREWLEQQAVADILAVEDAAAEAGARRYFLPDGYAEVLLGRDSLSYLAPLARFTVGLTRPMPVTRHAQSGPLGRSRYNGACAGQDRGRLP